MWQCNVFNVMLLLWSLLLSGLLSFCYHHIIIIIIIIIAVFPVIYHPFIVSCRLLCLLYLIIISSIIVFISPESESVSRVTMIQGRVPCRFTHWGRDKMDATSQTTFSSTFSWTKMYEFRLKVHWSLFLRVQLTIFQHWFRQWLGAVQATSHYLNQWWLIYRRINASLGLNEF